MNPDTTLRILAFVFAFAVVGMAFYGLVLNPLVLDDLASGALIAWGGSAIAFVFGQEIAKATSAASQKAFDKGVETPAPTGTTVTPQPNANTTTTVTSEPTDAGG